MTASVATREPERASAGLTWAWRREDLGDYPATSWTLKYAFRASATAGFTVNASADGTAHAVSIAAATTAAYAAGKYSWVAYVENGSTKTEVGRGTLIVDTPLAEADPRTHARKVLDAIEAVLENRATQDQMNYSISVGGSSRSLGRTPLADLVALRARYRAEVRQEEEAAKRAAGRPTRTRILTAFSPRR